MESELQAKDRGQPKWLAFFLIAFLCALLIWLSFGWVQNHTPIFGGPRDQKEAIELLNTARGRALSDSEFERLLVLLKSTNEFAQISSISTLELEVTRNPGRREDCIDALQRCNQEAETKIRDLAGKALSRLQGEAK